MPPFRRSVRKIDAPEDTLTPPERQRAFATSLGVTPIEIASPDAAFARKPRELAGILASLASCRRPTAPRRLALANAAGGGRAAALRDRLLHIKTARPCR